MSRFLPLSLMLGALSLAACGDNPNPAEPDGAGSPPPATLSSAAASNSWTEKAPPPYDQFIYGYGLGMAPNSAGQSIVYTFGGTSGDDGATGSNIHAYNAASNSWTTKTSHVDIYYPNGVGKIGSRLYFSGGYNEAGTVPSATNQVWAYDYSSDRMIRKADLPIYSAEGVTGVINGKLYVLPGACSGEYYPYPGYCATAATRRFYRYDPATNTWVSRPQVPHFHRNGAAAVIDGKLYVAGGIGGSYNNLSDLDVYDPATNSWRTLASIPTGGPASGAALQGQFYVVVQHFNGSTPDHRTYAYNRLTNQWKAKAAPAFAGMATRVTENGLSYLFMASGNRSALYTP